LLPIPADRILTRQITKYDARRSSMSAIDTPAASDTASRRDALVERLFGAAVGTLDLLTVYLGNRLGFYRALADHGSMTSIETAEATGTHERYVREWLEQQAVSGILDQDGATDPAMRRYSLPPGHDEALLDETSLNYITPIARLVVACVAPLEALLEAFRTGEGVPYAAFGTDLHGGQAEFTRPMFDNLLGTEWLPAIPEVDSRLHDDPPARVADVACGEGRSSIAIARAYPKVNVDGIDLDESSIRAANEHVAGSGVQDRVTFLHRDAADEKLSKRYDLVYIHEALHDMSYPVETLRACRSLLVDGGSVVIGDERVADAFTAPGDDLERFYYGFSVLHCLPVGMVGEGAAGTGTVMRAETVKGYSEKAGFGKFEILPIQSDFYRFYRITP
jgi:2-polyprenyl-3-methyl-5-hydroxy-6-metoxy-1,4-benzoquinol methylase